MNNIELSEITSRLDFQELSKVYGWPCIPIYWEYSHDDKIPN